MSPRDRGVAEYVVVLIGYPDDKYNVKRQLGIVEIHHNQGSHTCEHENTDNGRECNNISPQLPVPLCSTREWNSFRTKSLTYFTLSSRCRILYLLIYVLGIGVRRRLSQS